MLPSQSPFPCHWWGTGLENVGLGDVRPDVGTYGEANPAFPHQSTSEQWFNESQTESYRMLGYHTIEEVCKDWKGGPIEGLAAHIGDACPGSRTSARAASDSV